MIHWTVWCVLEPQILQRFAVWTSHVCLQAPRSLPAYMHTAGSHGVTCLRSQQVVAFWPPSWVATSHQARRLHLL